METILQAVLDVTGVGAALVFDSAGRLVCHRGHAIYDQALCEQLSGSLLKAVDTIQLQQEDWESVSARYADGKLLLRNLGAAGGGTHVLAVVADASLNLSFATVAMRVATNKLKRALGGGAASSAPASAQPRAAASSSLGSSSLPAGSSSPRAGSSSLSAGSSSMPANSRLADPRPALANSSGLSWSQTSSVGLSRIAVADPASSTFLSRCAKELARHVGPMAKVYVEEAVHRVSPDAPFTMSLGAKLLDDLAGQIEDEADRTRFRQSLALAKQVLPADHPKWIELVTGKDKFRPSFLAARMYLASARMEVGKSGASPELIRKYAAGLRELFVENANNSSAREDLAKIGQALALANQIPPADHPKWIELVTGKQKFRPSFLAARMYLASARMEIGKPGASPELIRNYAAGLRELFVENANNSSVRQDLAKIFK